MLQTQAVSPKLLELLNNIMKSEIFSDIQNSPEIFKEFDWEKCKKTIKEEYLKLII